uniref:(California timema) hypothetical protein n=1 Tax=Timema californicum TaxID=61474 RepID=A0A7R9J938_TIMCA|nr:unnamed protein product [Timema californicum]
MKTHDYSGFFDAGLRLRKQYGSIFRLWLGPQLFILLTKPQHIEVILSSNKLLDKGSNYQFLDKWLGTGLLTSTGTKWRNHRRIITPTFHFKILEDFLEVFNTNGRKMVDKLRKEVGGLEFDIHSYVTLCTLDIICETAMGISINAQDGGSADFVEATKGMADIVVKRSFRPWLQPNLLFWLSSTGRSQRKYLYILQGMTDKVIKSRKYEFAENKNKNENKEEDEFVEMVSMFTTTTFSRLPGIDVYDHNVLVVTWYRCLRPQRSRGYLVSMFTTTTFSRLPGIDVYDLNVLAATWYRCLRPQRSRGYLVSMFTTTTFSLLTWY